MVVYIKLEPREELAIKKAILEAVNSSVTSQNTGIKIAKLKRKKKYATRGTTKAINEINKEIVKIKEMFPELEIKTTKPKREKKRPVKLRKAKKEKTKRKKKKYKVELEKLKEIIATLG